MMMRMIKSSITLLGFLTPAKKKASSIGDLSRGCVKISTTLINSLIKSIEEERESEHESVGSRDSNGGDLLDRSLRSRKSERRSNPIRVRKSSSMRIESIKHPDGQQPELVKRTVQVSEEGKQEEMPANV